MLSYVMIALALSQPAPSEPAPGAPAPIRVVRLPAAAMPAPLVAPPVADTDLCAWAERMALEPPCRRPEDCRAYQEWSRRFGEPGTMRARPPAVRVVPLGPLVVPAEPGAPRPPKAAGATCLAGR
jgi:hypothetical protein